MTAAMEADGLPGCEPPPGTPAEPVTVRSETAPNPDFRLSLNIPAYRLDVWHDSVLLRSFPVSVGMPDHRTPRGEFGISSVTWNPWWIPPPSDWARGEKRTRPGPRNPMGKVKLAYADYYYLHGTPDSTSIGRAASHGCVRLHNRDAIDIALLLQEAASAAVDEREQDELQHAWRPTRTVALATPVGLDVRYDLVEVRDSTVFIYPDIYGLATEEARTLVLQALQAVGARASAIDTAAVDTFALRFRAGGSAHLSTLLRPD